MYSLVKLSSGEYLVSMDCEYDEIDDTHCVLKIGGTKEVALIVAKYGKLEDLLQIMINLNNNIPKVTLTKSNESKSSHELKLFSPSPQIHVALETSISPEFTKTSCMSSDKSSNLSSIPETTVGVDSMSIKDLLAIDANTMITLQTTPLSGSDLFNINEMPLVILSAESLTIGNSICSDGQTSVVTTVNSDTVEKSLVVFDGHSHNNNDDQNSNTVENSGPNGEKDSNFSDPDYENTSDQESYDDDSSDLSDISELEDLEDLVDDVLREDSSLKDAVQNISLSFTRDIYHNGSNISLVSDDNNNECLTRSLTHSIQTNNISTQSSLSMLEINNISTQAAPLELNLTGNSAHDNTCISQNDKNDESYVPEAESSVNQSVASVNQEGNVLSNVSESTFDETEEINNLISGTKAPSIDELNVYTAGQYTKTNFCCFCFEMKVVISRHFEAVHADEPEVQAFMAMGKRSIERRKAIEVLRLKGNDLYNRDQDFNEGELLVARQLRKDSGKDAADFRPCHNCKGWFLSIHRHRAKCIGEKNNYGHKANTILSKLVSNQFHKSATPMLKKVLAVMNDDEVSKIIRNDPLLVVFANDLCMKYTKQQQHDMIRARLRMLGNLLLKLKEFNSSVLQLDENKKISNETVNNPLVVTFADIIDARVYDNMIRAIKILVGSDEEKKEFRAPSVATSYGTWIIKVAKTLTKESIKIQDYVTVERVKYFLDVHEVEYPIKINTLAYQTQTKQKRHKKEDLPTMEDINLFRDFLETKLVNAYNQLEQKFSYEAWLSLSKATLIYILLFNRKRPGELERVLIEDYKNAEKFSKSNPDSYAKLSDEHKALVDEYLRFEFGGKKDREVPLLLSSGMQNFVDAIINHRQEAGVDKKNPFIFGIPGYDGTRYKHLRACYLLRQFSSQIGAKYPDRLRATRLRKHFATTVASLEIDECRVYDISNFMGHAEKIHRHRYRQPVVTRDLLGVSEILEMASGVTGNVKRTHGNHNALGNSQPSCSFEPDFQTTNTSTIFNKTRFMNLSTSIEDDSNSLNDSDEDSSSTLQQIRTKYTKKNPTHEKKDDQLNNIPHDIVLNKNTMREHVESTLKKGNTRKTTKVRWTEEERNIVLNAFSQFITDKKLPSTKLVQKLLDENPNLKRTVATIRTWIHNQYSGQLKKNVDD